MNKIPTLLFVSNTSWSIYNFRIEVIEALKRKGYRVVVAAPKDSFTTKIVAKGIDFIEIDLNNYSTNVFKEFNVIVQLLRVYRQVHPDLIFHYTIKPNIYGSIAAFLSKKKSIIFITGLGQLFKFENRVVQRLTLRLYRFACNVSKEVWFLNDNDRDVFLYKSLVKEDKIRVLPSEGINLDWFKTKRSTNTTDELVFLFAGRLLWEKGIAEYVEAAKTITSIYTHVRFQILGFVDQDNPRCVSYEQLMKWQRMGWIEYKGETTDIRPYMDKCDCFVFPSFYREGISRVLLEAASMETPIITTDNVGCKNVVIDERTGYLVQPKSVDDLVEKLRMFINLSHSDRLVMGKLGRRHVQKNYSQIQVNKIYSKVINRLVPNTLKRKVRFRNLGERSQ